MNGVSRLTYCRHWKVPVRGSAQGPYKAASDESAKVLRTSAVTGPVDDRSAERDYQN
jgi:hypothetical protein